MTPQEWYCRINGEVIGPVSARDLRTMVAAAELVATDEVRRGLDGAWLKVSTVKGLEFASTVRERAEHNSPTAGNPSAKFTYKMVQIPQAIEIREGSPESEVAAAYLQEIVNDHARQGWDFYRVDSVGVRVRPGCLGLLLGHSPTQSLYYVVTFRKPA